MAFTEPAWLADVEGDPLANPQQSIFAHIERGLLKKPDEPAVVCMHQTRRHLEDHYGLGAGSQGSDHGTFREHGCLSLTYQKLHRGALDLVKGLLHHGARSGTTLLYVVPNGGEYALLMWAGAILQLTLSAVDPGVLEADREDELRSYLELLKPSVVVVPNACHAVAVNTAAARSKLKLDLGVFLQNDSHSDKQGAMTQGWVSFRQVLDQSMLVASFNEHRLLDEARRDNPARIHSIMFTSGTSAGRPKGCPLSVASQTHALESQSWLINPENSNRVLQQAHNSRAIGGLHTLLTWQAGGTLVMPTGPSFSLDHTVDAILYHKASFVVLTPPMTYTVEQAFLSRGAKAGDWDHVQTIQVGGDAVTKEALVKAAALFPRADVLVNHGMSEAAGLFKWPFTNWPTTQIPFFAELVCPVGTVAHGARVRILDLKLGNPVQKGQPGEMHVSCPSLIRAYIGGGDSDNRAFYSDKQGRRWMKTGDMAIMDEEGRVYILGREKHAIHRAGVAIMPTVIESCIEKYTGAQVSLVVYPT